MSDLEKMELLKDLLELDELDFDTELSELEEWDSLAVLSYMALAKKQFNKTISSDTIRSFKVVRDLCDAL